MGKSLVSRLYGVVCVKMASIPGARTKGKEAFQSVNPPACGKVMVSPVSVMFAALVFVIMTAPASTFVAFPEKRSTLGLPAHGFGKNALGASGRRLSA